MPRLPLREHKLFFFDCETGGLDPRLVDMVEVACVVTDFSGKNVLAEYSAKVFPKKPVDPRAAEVNGYTREKWATEAIELDVAMVKMLEKARDCVFCAHNAPFDWGFFSTAMAARGQRWRGDYHKIDTVALATPLLMAGTVPDLKLGTLTKHFGIPHENAHSAQVDVRACHQLFCKLMEMYEPLFDPRGSFNGRTADFDSAYEGSNPSPRTDL